MTNNFYHTPHNNERYFMFQDKKGVFITFEGGEGAGKTTQIQALASFLKDNDIDFVQTREPGGTVFAEQIRALRKTVELEVLLLTAARLDHVKNVIMPALQKGQWVLCDRFVDSTLAYQHWGWGMDRQKIQDLHLNFLDNLYPDITFLLDCSAEFGLNRAKNRQTSENNSYDSLTLEFHNKVHDGFRILAKENSERFHILDATMSVADLSQTIQTIITQGFL
jgi:dTMP kinase